MVVANPSSTVKEIDFIKDVRSAVSDSAEFRALASQLHIGVREALRTEDLPSFGSLTRGDQEALINRVRSELLEKDVYKDCRDATWRALDANLDKAAEALLSSRVGGVGGRRGPGPSWPAGQEEEQEREERSKNESSGKVGTILELASTSASELLDRWPAAQDELVWLLNAELPTALRRAVWALKLRAPAARAEYERKRSESVFATLSLRDGAVQQGCQVCRAHPSDLESLIRKGRELRVANRHRFGSCYCEGNDPDDRALAHQADPIPENVPLIRRLAAALAAPAKWLALGADRDPQHRRRGGWKETCCRWRRRWCDSGFKPSPSLHLVSELHSGCWVELALQLTAALIDGCPG